MRNPLAPNERILRLIEELAAGVAHELNTPVGTILTNAEFVLPLTEDEDVMEGLEMIKKAALRCKNITEKLLLYSRRKKFERTAFRVSRLIESSLEFLERT